MGLGNGLGWVGRCRDWEAIIALKYFKEP